MKSFMAVLALALTFSMTAIAEPIVIMGGSSNSSTYTQKANELSEALAMDGIESEVILSNGSMHSLKFLGAGKADIILSQNDAYLTYLSSNAGMESDIEILAPILKECVWLVGVKGGVDSLSDLSTEGTTLTVGKVGGGTAITYEFMQSLEPSFVATTVNKPAVRQALAMAASTAEDNAAVMQVSSCDNVNTKLHKHVSKNSLLKFLNVDDWDLNDTHPTLGKPVYEFAEVRTLDGVKLETIQVDASLFVNSDLDDAVRDAVQDALLVM